MRGDPRIYDSPQIRVKRHRQILDLGSGQIQHKNTKTDGRSGSGICVNFTPIPPIHIGLYRRSQIPPGVRCYRGICGRMVSGVVPPHTSHHRVPLASEYPGLPSAPRSATTSTKAETRNEEGKTKMSTIRDVVEMAFAAGHAAGMVDATDERQAEVPIGDLRTEWFVKLDRLARDAEQMLGRGQ